MKEVKPEVSQWAIRVHDAVKSKVDKFSKRFHEFPPGRRKAILVIAGSFVSFACLTLVVAGIYGYTSSDFKIDSITLPKNIIMDNPQSTKSDTLVPLGKMKGEIDGEFEAFYVATSKDGKLFINRSLEYGKDAYRESQGWLPITKQKLDEYAKQLHFISAQRKGIRH